MSRRLRIAGSTLFERRIGPLDCAIAALRVARQQRFALLADILDDGAGLEDLDLAVAEAGHLVERLLEQIFGRPFAARAGGPDNRARPPRAPSGRAGRAPGPGRNRGTQRKAVISIGASGLDRHAQASCGTAVSIALAPCSAAAASIHMISQMWPSGILEAAPVHHAHILFGRRISTAAGRYSPLQRSSRRFRGCRPTGTAALPSPHWRRRSAAA